ncbi:hypothetical protein O181_099545 [Austropuccinia psidii MF-1]|uniref:Uncharacterized protein n=1 Tax=Austropuccinia psidii MF-1 TaxID=1389203 RepID=A0A9Q3JB62_9BASI|nr:hypothetical protein [Austropuccinia psidii MF-1]
METCFTNLLKRSGQTIPSLDSKVWTEGGSFLPPPDVVQPPPLITKEIVEARLYCDSVEDAVIKIKQKQDSVALLIVSLPCGMAQLYCCIATRRLSNDAGCKCKIWTF